MAPRKFNIYIKSFSWNTQHKKNYNAVIIAQTKNMQHVWNFHLFNKVCYGLKYFLK